MTPEELQAELRAGLVRPAYLLAGEETLFRDDAREAIQAAVLGGGPGDFDLDRLRGETTSAGALLDALRTLPVLAPRRLVSLREPEAGRSKAEGLTDAVAEAVVELAEVTTAVLLVEAARVDRRARWVRAFREPAATVHCDPLRGSRVLAAFVEREARRQGASLGAGAAEALVERIGPQLLLLRQEIAKLALFAGQGEEITRDHVAMAASDIAEEPIWELTDAIGEGRAGRALEVLGRVLSAGAAPPVVLASLATHFRKLARLSAGGSVAGNPFAVRVLERQARRYSGPRLRAFLGTIHETDEALKGRGSLPADIALERLVLILAS